jgi:hypothetical protein
MKRKTLTLLITALLCPLAARAQSTPQTAQQPAKPYSSLDDDPQFKRLSPEQQELVRKMMASVDKAVAAEQNKPGATPKVAPPNPAPNAQPGCTALPVKKPRFRIPKAVQDAINKQTKQLGSKTGVALDPNAPAQAVNDAQGKPCPASPAPAPKPANQ